MSRLESLYRVVKANLFTPGHRGRWGLPMIFWGGIGIGKSSFIEDVAISCGLGFNSTIGSICEPPDIAGLQMPNEERTHVVALAAPWVRKNHEHEQGSVQLFDEGTSCSPMVQSAMMQVLLTGQAGDVEVKPGVRFMMAANPTDVAANANDLEMPLANRMGHVHVTPPSNDEWADWLTTSMDTETEPLNAKAIEAKVLEKWPKALAKAKGLIASFIRKRPKKLHDQPDPGSDQASLAWCSPRTWEFATRALASSYVHELDEVERATFVGAFIGKATYGELKHYEKESDLPDVEELLDGVSAFEPNPDRMDQTFAVLEMCQAFLADEPKKGDKSKEGKLRLKRAAAYWKLCEVVHDQDPDVIIPSAKLMVRNKLDTRRVPEAAALMLKIQPLVSKVLGKRRR